MSSKTWLHLAQSFFYNLLLSKPTCLACPHHLGTTLRTCRILCPHLFHGPYFPAQRDLRDHPSMPCILWMAIDSMGMVWARWDMPGTTVIHLPFSIYDCLVFIHVSFEWPPPSLMCCLFSYTDSKHLFWSLGCQFMCVSRAIIITSHWVEAMGRSRNCTIMIKASLLAPP